MKPYLRLFLASVLSLGGLAACLPNQDPVAVITCEQACADPGTLLSFSGAGSSDPEGGALSYAFDFGDGTVAHGPDAVHAYAQPGAYRVRLTVRDERGASDDSSCIVSVGGFPQGVGPLSAVDFSPNHTHCRILEQGNKPKHGGLVYGFFTAPVDAVPDTILVNGLPADSSESEMEWCEVVGTELRAGEPAILRCHSYSAAFDGGAPVELEVKAGEVSLWRARAALPAPSLVPSYVTSDVAGREILVHVRNDARVPLEVTGLSVNGVDVSAFALADAPRVLPARTATIRVPWCDGVPLGEWLVFTVHGRARDRDLAVTRALRLFAPVFPVGDWNGGSDDVFNNPERLKEYMDRGIDLFIYSPSAQNPPDSVLALAEEKGFYVFTHEGATDERFDDFVRQWRDHPRILTNAVSGEGEFSGEPGDALARVRHHRELWGGAKPLWVYNACSYDFPSWGPLADMGGMDHYCVMAPKCNVNLPPFSWDRVEMAGTYAAEIKRAAEPGPVWNWTQGPFNTWNIRCTTADEMRAQWYQVISRGTRGLLWFRYTSEWGERCSPEDLDEMTTLARELEPLKEILLEGEARVPGTAAWTFAEDVDVAATVSPRGMAVFLMNLDYTLRLIRPFLWVPKQDVGVEVEPPAGFEPDRFYLLQGEKRVPLAWEKIGPQRWRFVVPRLDVAAAVLVLPEP